MNSGGEIHLIFALGAAVVNVQRLRLVAELALIRWGLKPACKRMLFAMNCLVNLLRAGPI
jgi:hypothetical protein